MNTADVSVHLSPMQKELVETLLTHCYPPDAPEGLKLIHRYLNDRNLRRGTQSQTDTSILIHYLINKSLIEIAVHSLGADELKSLVSADTQTMIDKYIIMMGLPPDN